MFAKECTLVLKETGRISLIKCIKDMKKIYFFEMDNNTVTLYNIVNTERLTYSYFNSYISSKHQYIYPVSFTQVCGTKYTD